MSHKTGLNKFKMIQIIQSMLSLGNGINLKISNKKCGKFSNIWKHTLRQSRSKNKAEGKLKNSLN